MKTPRKRNRSIPSAKVPDPEREAEAISEEELDRIEADPDFQRMMKDSERDMRAGRYMTHEEAIKR